MDRAGEPRQGLSIIPFMSPLKQLLLAQTDYSAWATRQLLKACSPLTSDQLDRGLGASHSSILRTFRHIHDGERVWLGRIIEGGTQALPSGPAPEHLTCLDFLIHVELRISTFRRTRWACDSPGYCAVARCCTPLAS